MTNLFALLNTYKVEIATVVTAIGSMAAPSLPRLFPATDGVQGEISRDLMIVAGILAYCWGVKVVPTPAATTPVTNSSMPVVTAPPAPFVPTPGMPMPQSVPETVPIHQGAVVSAR